MNPENIHTYITGSFLNFHGEEGGFFELKIQMNQGTYNWNSEDIGREGEECGSKGDKQECECMN